MSTTYYALRHPVARVREVSDAMGTRYDAVTRSGDVGATFRPDCLHILADLDSRVAHRSGNVISVSGTGPDNAQAISDYGELVTLGDLRRGRAP